MRTARFAFSLAVFALVFSSPYAAHGQVVSGDGGGIGSASGIIFSGLAGQGAQREPYTAVRKTTHVQKLADGTTITKVTTIKEAHDSSGRTYSETHTGMPDGPGEQAPEQVVHVINDPVNRIRINWGSNSKEVTLMHMPDPIQNPPVQLPQPPPTHPTPPPQVSQRPVPPRPDIENLGTETINGIEAEGRRVTRIIPVGSEGNDRPMTVVNETWTSPELKMVVKSINDDPRTGTNTMEMTDFERGEPDPALFQVPAGYTVREIFPNQPN